MNAADWVIACIIGFSMLLSLKRGFTREAISLAAWVVALFGARILATSLSALLIGHVDGAVLRELIAFGVLFIVILFVGLLVAQLFGEVVKRSVLSFSDRLLGMVFGFSRGILLVTVALAYTRPYFLKEAWWEQSILIAHLSVLEDWSLNFAYTVAGWISS